MKKSLILLAVGISMAMSCQLNELDVPKTKGETFYAVIEGSDMTRTTLDEDNNVLWSKNDQISIFEKSTVNSKYQVKSSSVGETYGTFTKVIAEDNSQTHRFNHNIAIYPYQGDLRYLSFSSSSSLYQFKGFSLPATQTYVKNSFASGAFPMVAVSENTELTFRNVCGGILLKLKGSKKITSIKIQGKNNEKLSGSATLRIYYDGTVPYIEMAYDASTSVNLDCGSGVQLNESKATEFIIVLPPLIFTKGFTVTVTDSNDEDHVIETSKSNEVKRSSLLAMPEMALNGIPSDPEPQEGDYIDEYGINHGPGIAIGNVVWAPVNCGYHETDYPYGKLYQWGRKYGQGYSGPLYVDGNKTGDISDATYPTVEDGTIKEGGVSLAGGQSQSNKDVFFTSTSEFNYDWLYPQDSKLWNSGTEGNPVKTDNDPCPEGWRVPTYNELYELRSNHSSWTKNTEGQSGYWFSGASTYAEGVPQIFLPAAGSRGYDGGADDRGDLGRYWSSRPYGSYACNLGFNSGDITMYYYFRYSGYSVRCVQESGFLEETVPVSDIELSHESLDLQEGETAQLIATVIPSDATDKNVVWNSDTPSVATVDQIGLVTAVSSGTAKIYAYAGDKTAICTITVSSPVSSEDYIDEYGINHGAGVEIDGIVWAPVNCGYHEDYFKYGKLYQWGRKYGQGYSGNLYDINGSKVGNYSDGAVPTMEQGGVSVNVGNQKNKEHIFYLGVSNSDYDWAYPHDSKVWNSGTDSKPARTEHDPCPDGWRVPTDNELKKLVKNYSSWTTDENGQAGYWFSGSKSYTSSAPKIFLPASGYRNYNGNASQRGDLGYYWASGTSIFGASGLLMISIYAEVFGGECANGYSVRCVQEPNSSKHYVPVSNIQISHSSLDLSEYETTQLTVDITPSEATYDAVVWSSDTPSVATVDQSGLVKAISSGTARISATADSKVATCTVNVSSSGVDDYIDGFDDPENGVVILQKATRGSGTDIVIMGDGFSKKHFEKNGKYKEIMNKAYEDFFSIEPYTSLKEYFNVYYINVLSEEDHDAVPYYDYYGNQNGATQGTAVTKLGTQFTPGSTSIDGNDDVVLEYATQAIKAKGSYDGGECTDNEAYNRAHKALVIVLPNVKCYAGTCLLAWGSRNDYADAYSIAYCALGADDDGIDCKYTLLHEAGGHGFGKLGDEYSGNYLNRFNTIEWLKLRDNHNDGVYRNINEYWTEEEAQRWSGLEWDYTTESNVYWTELLDDSYGYTVSEGLGIYQGANTYTSLFCRPSENSVMNSHFNYNGQYFNAISRWAIWYRVMRLTNSTNASSFKSSLDEFINFDRTLNIIQNNPNVITRSNGTSSEMHAPLASPVLIECEWRGNRLVRP